MSVHRVIGVARGKYYVENGRSEVDGLNSFSRKNSLISSYLPKTGTRNWYKD